MSWNSFSKCWNSFSKRRNCHVSHFLCKDWDGIRTKKACKLGWAVEPVKTPWFRSSLECNIDFATVVENGNIPIIMSLTKPELASDRELQENLRRHDRLDRREAWDDWRSGLDVQDQPLGQHGEKTQGLGEGDGPHCTESRGPPPGIQELRLTQVWPLAQFFCSIYVFNSQPEGNTYLSCKW